MPRPFPLKPALPFLLALASAVLPARAAESRMIENRTNKTVTITCTDSYWEDGVQAKAIGYAWAMGPGGEEEVLGSSDLKAIVLKPQGRVVLRFERNSVLPGDGIGLELLFSIGSRYDAVEVISHPLNKFKPAIEFLERGGSGFPVSITPDYNAKHPKEPGLIIGK